MCISIDQPMSKNWQMELKLKYAASRKEICLDHMPDMHYPQLKPGIGSNLQSHCPRRQPILHSCWFSWKKTLCKEFLWSIFWVLTFATGSTPKIKTFIPLAIFLESITFIAMFSVEDCVDSAICCSSVEPSICISSCTLRWKCLLLISYCEYLNLYLFSFCIYICLVGWPVGLVGPWVWWVCWVCWLIKVQL